MINYVRKTQSLWTENDMQMAIKAFGREGTSDMLQNCSGCLILAYKEGCTVVWIGHFGIKEDKPYSRSINKSG
jgi:hypothetical protein